MHKSVPNVRCAIYTRKSTEEGLDQDFNSLHAQREAAEAYIISQKYLGWTLVPTRYDDGGFTGGNLDHPASSNCSKISTPGVWIASLYIRLTVSAGRSSISQGWWTVSTSARSVLFR